MAVPAVILSATRDDCGSVTLHLGPVEGEKHGPQGDMVVLNAPPRFEDAVVGMTVGVSTLYVWVGDVKLGRREGKDRMRLVKLPPKLNVERIG